MQKRQRTVSVLFISDEWKEPFSLKIRFATLKVLAFVGVVCAAGLVVSGVAFYRMVQRTADYEVLRAQSGQVEQERAAIRSVAGKLDGIIRRDAQLRRLLGAQIEVPEHRLLDAEGRLREWGQIAALTVSEPAEDLGPPTDSEKATAELQQLPTTLPMAGYITRGFEPRDPRSGAAHLGIDIVAEENSIIRAAAAGVVLFANWTPDGGHTVILSHGAGFMTFYKHNKRLLVEERGVVARGAPIALLGNSGVSSGPHLHFEIWRNGKPVDPREYLLTL